MIKDTRRVLVLTCLVWGIALLLLSIIVQFNHDSVHPAKASGNTALAKPDNTCGPSYWCVVPSSNLTGANTLNAVAAINYTDVWAVGVYNQTSYGGQTLTEHWDGKTWNITSSPNKGQYNTLAATSAYASSDV